MSNTNQMHLRISEHSPSDPSGVRQRLVELDDMGGSDDGNDDEDDVEEDADPEANRIRLELTLPLITRCQAKIQSDTLKQKCILNHVYIES